MGSQRPVNSADRGKAQMGPLFVPRASVLVRSPDWISDSLSTRSTVENPESPGDSPLPGLGEND